MKYLKSKIALVAAAASYASLANALSLRISLGGGTVTFSQLIARLRTQILNPLIGIALTVALAFFFWGMVKYLSKISDAKAREEGRGMMVWGIVALFVMVSVWGLVNLIRGTLDLDDSSAPSTIVVP